MKKRIIIISLIFLAILIVFEVHYTYATNSTQSDTYTVTLNDSDSTITIPKKTSKIVYYHISNDNKGTVKYAVGYTSNNIKAKVWYDTIDAETGFMNYGEHKFIKLKLINDSSTDDTVTLSTILGYERGGDLIIPENTTLVTEKIRETNYIMASTASAADSNYLRSNLKKEEIGSITFTNDNIVPDGMTSVDVSRDKDGTVMMWYGNANSNGVYDVYIGSENGITSIYNRIKSRLLSLRDFILYK